MIISDQTFTPIGEYGYQKYNNDKRNQRKFAEIRRELK